MAKGQKRSGREVKKPKASKKPTGDAATFLKPGVLPDRPPGKSKPG